MLWKTYVETLIDISSPALPVSRSPLDNYLKLTALVNSTVEIFYGILFARMKNKLTPVPFTVHSLFYSDPVRAWR
jgi:hypothetical protein